MNKSGDRVDAVIEVLARHSQRATYGAVGGLIGFPAQSVMSGKPKTPRNSWVVSKATGRPTGYLASETHPALEQNPDVISTPEALAAWLGSHK